MSFEVFKLLFDIVCCFGKILITCKHLNPLFSNQGKLREKLYVYEIITDTHIVTEWSLCMNFL